VKESSERPVLPICILAHECLNKLSVIIGNCDLAHEKAPSDSECLKRITTIRDTAKAMADALNGHLCELSELLPSVPVEEWPTSIGSHVQTTMRHDRRSE
jgi:hypothetical protein